jgi:putative nucleic acid modification protein with dual OB domain
MYRKTILCLANSWKTGGRCVAGKEFTGAKAGDWIRPVSPRPTHEIAPSERRYQDGTLAEVREIIEIPLQEHDVLGHQTENHVIDTNHPWRRAGVATWEQIHTLADAVDGPLWLNEHSTIQGLNDKIPEQLLTAITDSLKLVNVTDLVLRVALEPGWNDKPAKKKVRGSFTLNGEGYRLAVTDPLVTGLYGDKPAGNYPIGEATLCVSLSAPEYGHAFKLIATVLTAYRCR